MNILKSGSNSIAHKTILFQLALLFTKQTVFAPDFLPDKRTALRKRIERFAVRLNLVQRRRTHIAQNTRHVSEIIDDFIQCVNEHISMLQLPASAVVNIDETNIDFDMPSTTTLECRGARTASVQGTGCSQRATVLLGVEADGSKLPPFIVWKGSQSGTMIREVTSQALSNGYPVDAVWSVQKSGWMDEQLMLEWVERVWKPWLKMNYRTLELKYLANTLVQFTKYMLIF